MNNPFTDTQCAHCGEWVEPIYDDECPNCGENVYGEDDDDE